MLHLGVDTRILGLECLVEFFAVDFLGVNFWLGALIVDVVLVVSISYFIIIV